MRDFLGTELRVGDWVVKGGTGNSQCEYGMILHYITSINLVSISTERLSSTYLGGTNGYIIELRKTRIQNGNKCVLFEPPEKIKVLFSRVSEGTHTQKDTEFCVNWIHGTKVVGGIPNG